MARAAERGGGEGVERQAGKEGMHGVAGASMADRGMADGGMAEGDARALRAQVAAQQAGAQQAGEATQAPSPI